MSSIPPTKGTPSLPPHPEKSKVKGKEIAPAVLSKNPALLTAKLKAEAASKRAKAFAKQEVGISEETSLQMQKKFPHNVDALKKMSAKNFKNYAVENGRFVQVSATVQHDPSQVKQLMQQTYRQMWGTLINPLGYNTVKEKALKSLNELRDHLANEGLLKLIQGGVGSPLRILSSSVQRPEPTMQEYLREYNQAQKNQHEKRVYSAAIKRLAFKQIGVGKNAAEFIKEKASSESYAVRKPMSDLSFGGMTGERLGYSMDDLVKNNFALADHLGQLAGVNELISAGLNELMEGRLGFPLTYFSEGQTTHAFVENLGSYADLTELEGIANTTKKMPLEATQRFALGEIAMGSFDAHVENILILKNRAPMGIDFGRSLMDPLFQEADLRGAYFLWPQLDKSLSPEDQQFWVSLNVEDVISQLSDMLVIASHDTAEFKNVFTDPLLRPQIQASLQQLKANLLLIQEGIRNQFTPRQILALYLPPVDDTQLSAQLKSEFKLTLEEAINYDENLEKTGIDPNEAFGQMVRLYQDIHKSIMHPYILNNSGFVKAWKSAYHHGVLDAQAFKTTLSGEIANLKQIKPQELFSDKEHYWYRVANRYLPY